MSWYKRLVRQRIRFVLELDTLFQFDVAIVSPLIGYFATRFAQQHNILNDDVLRQGFAHIVNGQSRCGHSGQSFHFNTSLSLALDRGVNRDTSKVFVKFGLYVDRGQRNVVAQRNQFGCSFGRHNASNLGYGQNIALGHGIRNDQLSNFSANENCCFCDSYSFGGFLVADIDHVGFAILIDVREIAFGAHKTKGAGGWDSNIGCKQSASHLRE